jgi:hypothetical protein
MANEGGLKLTWWQVILLGALIGGGYLSNLVTADAQQEAENNKQNDEIALKLDTKEFVQYKTMHSREVKEIKQEVIDSKMEIVRILTRMENNR